MNMIDVTENEYVFNGIKIHQPTVFELAEVFQEEEDLILCLKLLIFSVKSLIGIKEENISEFQTFLSLVFTDTEALGIQFEKKGKLLKFLKLCFKDYEMSVVQGSFVFQKDDEIITLDSTNFDEFKLVLKRMFNIPDLFKEENEKKYNPNGDRAARIAEMLEKDDKKRSQQKNSTNKKGLIENYLTILSVGLQIPPSELSKKLTLYNLFNLYGRFIMRSGWDLDIQCRLAGASPKENPDNWLSLI